MYVSPALRVSTCRLTLICEPALRVAQAGKHLANDSVARISGARRGTTPHPFRTRESVWCGARSEAVPS
jgi:hypothetical protein